METNVKQFEDLIDVLQDLSETIRHVGIVATDFDDQSQDVLNIKINDMVWVITLLFLCLKCSLCIRLFDISFILIIL